MKISYAAIMFITEDKVVHRTAYGTIDGKGPYLDNHLVDMQTKHGVAKRIVIEIGPFDEAVPDGCLTLTVNGD